ncbi:MAG: Bordetella phage vB BbrM, partial [Pseudomonadota bacterium]
MDAAGVEYQTITIAGQSVRLFRCPTYRCDLSPNACAERFRLAQNLTDIAGVGHAAFLCKRCPIGAQHAGKSIKPRRSHQCLRCGSWSPKLVRGLVCVPCYNRQQEVMRGQDRRGHRPKAVVRFWDASPSKVLGQIPQVFLFKVEISGLGVR